MAYQVLPTSADAVESQVTRTIQPESGQSTVTVFSGPLDELTTLEAHYTSIGGITSTVLAHSRGRGTLTVTTERESLGLEQDDEGAVQELAQIAVSRDIKTAPYFETLTDEQVSDVLRYIENGVDETGITYASFIDLQKSLYGHLLRGQKTYLHTAYELRRTWVTTSTKELRVASDNPNRVVTLPRLSGVIKKLVKSLPAGEWLKKPTVVQSAGLRGWSVSVSYLWSEKWSVVYGGSFTGIFAAP